MPASGIPPHDRYDTRLAQARRSFSVSQICSSGQLWQLRWTCVGSATSSGSASTEARTTGMLPIHARAVVPSCAGLWSPTLLAGFVTFRWAITVSVLIVVGFGAFRDDQFYRLVPRLKDLGIALVALVGVLLTGVSRRSGCRRLVVGSPVHPVQWCLWAWASSSWRSLPQKRPQSATCSARGLATSLLSGSWRCVQVRRGACALPVTLVRSFSLHRNCSSGACCTEASRPTCQRSGGGSRCFYHPWRLDCGTGTRGGAAAGCSELTSPCTTLRCTGHARVSGTNGRRTCCWRSWPACSTAWRSASAATTFWPPSWSTALLTRSGVQC